MLGEAECLTENKDVIDYTKELFQHTLLYFPRTFISCGVKKKKPENSVISPIDRWIYLFSPEPEQACNCFLR